MTKLPPGERQPAPEQKTGKNIQEKLASLKDYLPGQTQLTYDFAEFLSTRAEPDLEPEGFDFMADLALNDLRTGQDGFTGKPLESKLAGYPPQIFIQFSMELPKIKKAIFESI